MLIERVRRTSDYKLIVVDREGIIIAATEKERVGVFHEASFIMMRDGLEKMVVTPEEIPNYLGVKAGIDMPLIIDGEIIGAFGISGIPEEIEPVITMAKMSIEAMMEFELLKEKTQRKNSDREAFYSLLLSDKLRKNEQLPNITKRLGCQVDALRISIVFMVEAAVPATLTQITESKNFDSREDFAFLNKENEIVVFRCLREKPEHLFKNYRQAVANFIEPITKQFDRYNIEYSYYVGSIQNNLNNYRFAYGHSCWLKENQKHNEFFYDYVDDYIKDQIPVLELNGIFQFFYLLFDKDLLNNYRKTVSLLAKNNYNLVTSSRESFLHKNTLMFRLNKIRSFLNLNPMQCADDRAFMSYLSYYIDIQQKSLLGTKQNNE